MATGKAIVSGRAAQTRSADAPRLKLVALRARWIPAAVIILVTVVAYWPSLGGAFVWDDAPVIVNNPMIHGGDGIVRFWTSTTQIDYWPVAYSTHWLEWRIFGDSPTGYRLVNLALHVTNALLVWRILDRLHVHGSWLCALVFAIHPVNVEAVAWILQRKTVLSTLLALCALLCFLRSEAVGRAQWNLAGVALFLAGMLSKSAVVMWPFTLLICRWWLARRLTRRDLQQVLPYFVVSLLAGLVGVWFQHFNAIGDDVVREDGLLSRLALAGQAVFFYLHSALWPVNLSFVYPRWSLDGPTAVDFIPDLLLLAGCGILFWFRRGRSAAGLAALGYYLVNLFPVLGFVDIYFMRYSLVADHWQYLALPGLLALMVGGVSYSVERWPAGMRRLAPVGACVVAGVLSAATFERSKVYAGADNESLWLDTLNKNPDSWLAHNEIGCVLLDRGDSSGAIDQFQRALRLNGNYGEAEFDLGKALHKQGRDVEALVHYDRAARLMPWRDIVHCNAASLLIAQGKLREAEAHLRQALEHEPASVDANFGMGFVQTRLGHAEEAIAHYRQVLESRPDHFRALLNLAQLYHEQRRFVEAEGTYRRAIVLYPASDIARADLAFLLANQGQYVGAVAELRAILQEQPTSRVAARHLAWLLATAADDQVRDAHEAVRLGELLCQQPNDARDFDVLAAAYAAAGRFDHAVSAADRALELCANNPSASALQKAVEERRSLYQAARAFRE